GGCGSQLQGGAVGLDLATGKSGEGQAGQRPRAGPLQGRPDSQARFRSAENGLRRGSGYGRIGARSSAFPESAIGSNAVTGESRPGGGFALEGCLAEDNVHLSDQWNRELSAGTRGRLRRARHSEF